MLSPTETATLYVSEKKENLTKKTRCQTFSSSVKDMEQRCRRLEWCRFNSCNIYRSASEPKSEAVA